MKSLITRKLPPLNFGELKSESKIFVGLSLAVKIDCYTLWQNLIFSPKIQFFKKVSIFMNYTFYEFFSKITSIRVTLILTKNSILSQCVVKIDCRSENLEWKAKKETLVHINAYVTLTFDIRERLRISFLNSSANIGDDIHFWRKDDDKR